MTKVISRTISGKSYQVTMQIMPDRTKLFYELTAKSKNLKSFSPEDQAVFRSMKNDISSLDADFSALEEELNRL